MTSDKDDSWSATPEFAEGVDRNREDWLERRCRAAYWGLYTRLNKPVPDGRHVRVKCACCGQGYTVNPHQGGTFLRRHAQSKHPRAWEWWSERARQHEARERAERAAQASAGGADGGADGDADGGAEDGAGASRGTDGKKRGRAAARDPRATFAAAAKTARTSAGGSRGPSGKTAEREGGTVGDGKGPSAVKSARGSRETTPKPPVRRKHASLMRLDPLRVGAGGVALLCADCEPFELRPRSFFVAWSGVMTLAWEGFPPAVAAVKRKISRAFPMLPEEKPGSRWAKTTLGCLREGARLNPDQLRVLAGLCATHREALTPAPAPDQDSPRSASATKHSARSTTTTTTATTTAAAAAGAGATGSASLGPAATDPNLDDDEAAADAMLLAPGEDSDADGGAANGAARVTPGCVSVRDLSVVVYQCRSLERVLSEQVISLRGHTSRAAPAPLEANAVNAVVEAFDGPEDADSYFFHAARDGSREMHYRETKFGVTLAARVGGKLPPAVAAFRDAVDAALPGMYVWFDDQSLHCTVRGLVEA